MNQTVEELTETKHTLTSESLQTLTTANSSIVAESTRTLHEWGESAISGRTSVLGALMTARVRAAKLLLMTTTSELANIAGGAPEGKSWKADVADDDWTALLERGQVLFVAFQQASVKKAGDKLDKARRTYIKEAQDAGVAVDEVKADVAAAEKEIARMRETYNEANLLAAVMEGGVEGAENCRSHVEEMVDSSVSSESLHPALWARVTKLMAR